MIDPVTALATATTAFNVIKKGLQFGRDIESMGSDLGRWMGALSDLDKAEQQARKPPFWKKVMFAKSVEQEAIEGFAAKKKAQNQRDELRQWIQFTLGPSAWDELIRTERDIRKQRQETIYAQQEMKQKVIEWTAIIVLIVVVLGFVFWIAWLYRRNKGYAEIKLPEFLPDPTSLLSSCCQFFGMIII